MVKKYDNPPIQEVICAFEFVDTRWDITKPGILFQKINEKLPILADHLDIRMAVDGSSPSIIQVPRSRFFSPGKDFLIQTGGDLLTINKLPPYITWKEYSKEISEYFRIYTEIIDEGWKTKRVSLRYINSIHFDSDIDISDKYFNINPLVVPCGYHNDWNDFNCATAVDINEAQDRLVLRMKAGLDRASVNGVSIMLDIDCFTRREFDKSSSHELLGWIEEAHTIIENCFEASITEKTRRMFKNGKSI